VASLRVDNEIILFDEEKLNAVKEILNNRVVSKEKMKEFLKRPTAFLDGALVNLDLGFSARVKGMTSFRHAYFGETDESGIDWFNEKFAARDINPISELKSCISDKSALDSFKEEYGKAVATGATEVDFEGKIFDISNRPVVEQTLCSLENWLDSDLPKEDLPSGNVPEEEPSGEPIVIDIELNDEVLASPSLSLDRKISEILLPETGLDWSNFARQPFPHQVVGIRWILGLALESNRHSGGLLADDMGLGKTFMALAAMDHLYKDYQKHNKVEKPCLVVAPLSLLENWKDEVSFTFETSPFKDIVLLQADGELSRFRVGGVEIKNQSVSDGEARVKYSLNIGSFTPDRLDMPRRLVLTTYQTLRDYQFSLCAIDWGLVVFDEAQNIKNPNALQTRAAKGLKADFRLIATGTPVENSLADFWCLMDTACPGYLGSYQDFRTKYISPILQAAGDELETVRGGIGRQLRERVGALMLRRIKEDNLEGLPNKSIFVGIDDDSWKYLPSLSSTMKDGQLDQYDEILAEVRTTEQNVVLSSLQRLRDVSLHPRLRLGGRLDTPKQEEELNKIVEESGKLRGLISLLDDIKSKDEKCIIFVINKRLQSFLAVVLANWFKLPPLFIINGDTKAVSTPSSSKLTRKKMIEEFEDRAGFNIIIMSPVAAGVGLTVVGANNVIHLERHWNPAKEAQATDRVYRIGQKRDVNIFIPLLHHPVYQSFDDNLHQLLSKKSLLRDAVVTPEQVVPTPGGFGRRVRTLEKRITSEDLKGLSWEDFEALCAELLQKEYGASSCFLTGHGSDYGADVVLYNEKNGILIQCKHTSTTNKYEGYSAIQEVFSSKVRYGDKLGRSFDRLIFITNATRLGRKLKELADEYSVEIIDGSQISDLLNKHTISLQSIISRLSKGRLSI
jgi:SNF2 family DNA or RNA helicase